TQCGTNLHAMGVALTAYESARRCFPPGDDAALAQILTEVLAGGPAVEAIVARGQTDAPARFSLEQMLNRYESLFAELLD
ncbi:MAG: DUF1559 domain-containing protein, partial [Opitutaceae bacterium]|nr:DUF1559 domain-containing protein [Opitutaceae bacterium]